MVRFARAEGSKGCNKKVLEEATPWEEMVAQTKAVNDIQDDTVKKKSGSENVNQKDKKRKKSIENSNNNNNENEIKTEYAINEEVKKKKKKKNNVERDSEMVLTNNVESNDLNNESIINDAKVPGDAEEITQKTLTNDQMKAGEKKKRRKKKGSDTKKAEPGKEFKINDKGQRVKVFKDGKERTWFDLPYEDGERMTRYKNMWVKKEMVMKLDELEATLAVQEQDSKAVMRKMMKAIRKAHKELRIELIYEQRNILMQEIRAKQGKDIEGKKNRKQKQAAIENEKKIAKKEKQKEKKLKDKQKSNTSSNINFEGEMANKNNSNMQSNIDIVNLMKDSNNTIQNDSISNNKILQEMEKKNIHKKFGSDDETQDIEESQNEEINTIESKKKFTDNPNDNNKNNKPVFDLKYEENDIMTQFEGWWVKKEVVPKLTAMQKEKMRKIYAARADRNDNSELSAEERLTLNRFMKKAKRGENRQLKFELIKMENRKAWKAKGEELKKSKKPPPKPGKDLGIKYDEDNDMVKFDGFWVKKESADRLNRLRGRLQSEGISEEELKAILQRERRKEERLLKNERKLVCYNCRQPGHMVSACPNVMTGSNTEDITICFKCGSTEHMARECQVKKKGSEFSHATCFICKEPGHISRECPDNPRGLYPQGGACKHCGSVEHLWRDCPEHKEESEATAIKVSCIDGTAIEGLDDGDMESEDSEPKEKKKKKKSKVIKFD